MENDDQQHRQFFVSWSWKREHLPDKLRFHRPYTYEFDSDTIKKLFIKQAIFKPSGFASTGGPPSFLFMQYSKYATDCHMRSNGSLGFFNRGIKVLGDKKRPSDWNEMS